jgi:hypothetical protein
MSSTSFPNGKEVEAVERGPGAGEAVERGPRVQIAVERGAGAGERWRGGPGRGKRERGGEKRSKKWIASMLHDVIPMLQDVTRDFSTE